MKRRWLHSSKSRSSLPRKDESLDETMTRLMRGRMKIESKREPDSGLSHLADDFSASPAHAVLSRHVAERRRSDERFRAPLDA